MADSRKSRIRIIGGKWRGRKLDVIDVEGLRPTPDRIRETLFNWLAAHCPGAIVLERRCRAVRVDSLRWSNSRERSSICASRRKNSTPMRSKSSPVTR
jgi:hypothetical protein